MENQPEDVTAQVQASGYNWGRKTKEKHEGQK